MEIPFCKAFLNKAEKDAVKSVISSGWLTMGQKVEEFERNFAEYVGAKYAVAVNSCTSALFLSLAREKENKTFFKVTVPSLTFAATANIIKHSRMEVEFVDVSRETYCADGYPEIGVCYGGNEVTNAPIIDSAHLIKNNQCKNSKSTICYSFYVTKPITTGEGGMICTNNKEDAEWFKKARLHGMSKDAHKRYTDKNKWEYDVEFSGWKMNMTDINAAIGIEQLKKLDYMEEQRRRVRDRYNKNLELNWKGTHIYPLLVSNRHTIIKLLTEKGIQTSVHFIPLHLMSAFKENEIKLPVTEYIGEREISLPIYPELLDYDVDYICNVIKELQIEYE